MNPLVHKEARLLLPSWIGAMALAIVPGWLVAQSSIYIMAMTTLVAGGLLLGLTPFGQEFNAGTFQQLLSQPMARQRLWRTKAGVLALAMFSILVAGVISFHFRTNGQRVAGEDSLVFLGLGICLLFVAFAGGLWTTLLFRQIAAAFWFAALVPSVIFMATAALVNKLISSQPDSKAPAFWGCAMLVIYSVAGLFCARSMFLRAQDTQWTGGTISIPDWLRLQRRRKQTRREPTRRVLQALVWNEFQAQHVSLLLALVLAPLHLLAVVLRKATFDPSHTESVLYSVCGFFWCLWFALPLLVGSAAVAEERKLGTLESHLCLPATRRLQFGVKIGIALLLGVLFGGLMPWIIEGLGALLRIAGEFPAMAATNSAAALAVFCWVAFVITFVSFYASTLTRNLLQALGVAILVFIALWAFAAWAFEGGVIRSGVTYLWRGPLAAYIGGPILFIFLLFLGFSNYRNLVPNLKLWSANGAALVGALALITISTTLVYNRAWEWLATLEPKHGPPRISGPISPKICSAGTRIGKLSDGMPAVDRRVFVLLPGGRLWAANQHRFQVTDQQNEALKPDGSKRWFNIRVPVPIGGIFVGSSNWVQLASDFGHVFAIQSDGSLWKIFASTGTNLLENLSAPVNPERIGGDSDWKSLVAGFGHFLALKNDGTIWGWGNNYAGQLGSGTNQFFTNGWIRVGTDSDWSSVFASQHTSVGIKRDGSVWKWGNLATSPDGYNKTWKQSPHPEPIRWNFDGKGWRDYLSPGDCDLILKEDGSIWAWGNLRAYVFGKRFFVNEYGYNFTPTAIRVGNASDWAQIVNNFGALAGLKRNGQLVRSELYGPRLLFWRNVWAASRYSDWLALDRNAWINSCLALAADGTLCAWDDPMSRWWEESVLLGPSRKPLWTANIFQASGRGGDSTSRTR